MVVPLRLQKSKKNYMKFFIKIDADSIKKNENYGQIRYLLSGVSRIQFECKKLPEQFKDGENCFVSSHSISPSGETFNGEITSEQLYNDVLLGKIQEPTLSITKTQETVTVDSNFEPEFFFKYENEKIRCSNCGESFMSDDLLSEESGSEEFYSTSICPKVRRI